MRTTALRAAFAVFFTFALVVGVALGTDVMISGYSPLPIADYWRELPFVERALAGNVGLGDFWAQHNEHRILIARLQFLVDFLLFHGTSVFLFTSIAVSSLVLAASFAVAVHVETRDLLLALGAFAVAAVSTMSPAGIENLTWSFQVQFVQVFMFAALSVLAVVVAARSDSRTRRTALTALSVLFAVAATYSMSSGLLVWPVIFGGALVLRLGRRDTVVLALAGVVTVASFLWQFEGARNEAAGPVDFATFVAAYLGSAVWGAGFNEAVLVGAIGLVLLPLGLVLAWRGRLESSVAMPFGAGVATFVLLTASQTALGRLHLGTAQAISSRYSIASFTFWLALVVLFLQPVRERLSKHANAGLAYLACAAAATLFVGFRTLPDPDFQRETRWGREATVLTYRVGVIDDSGTVTGVAVGGPLVKTLRWMARERFGPFAPGGVADGMRVDTDGRTTSRPCLGEVESSDPVERGYRIKGWVASPSGDLGSHDLVVLDADGHTVGLGLVGDHRPDIAQSGAVETEWTGFAAYLRQQPRGALEIQLVDEDGRTPICRLVVAAELD